MVDVLLDNDGLLGVGNQLRAFIYIYIFIYLFMIFSYLFHNSIAMKHH